MIPWVVGRELRATLLDYLRSTWSIADRRIEAALFAFLSGKDGLFQGPYLKLALPFAPSVAGATIPLEITPPHPPHRHQLEAWQRLSSRGQAPRATLITTGTGSGKTECFMYPLLDHVHREKQRGTPGIKAIVLYPMNALASDQAGRFAEAIWKDERLRGKVRVGLFVGGDGDHRTMGRDHVVDDNDKLRAAPPDILLTNYRMLDLLLQRPKDARLWAENQPDTLRYLVLDELHTYDGAQGTDVACLIRRLGARLGSGEGICPVGTSATIGSGDTRTALLEFASTLFDQRFLPEAFVGETRLSPAELARGASLSERMPDEAGPWPAAGEGAEAHVAACVRAWLPEAAIPEVLPGDHIDRVALGLWVLRLPIVLALLEIAHQRPRSSAELEAELASRLPSFAAGSSAERQGWLASALSLVSYAQRDVAGNAFPLVSVQTTLWVREVRRLLSRVADEPSFRFFDDAPPPAGEAWLPRYACQDCGHGGWLVTESGPGDTIGLAYKDIARAFQERSADLRLLHADAVLSEDADDPEDGTPGARARANRVAFLDADGKRLLDRAPDGRAMPCVQVALFEDEKCPGCGARHSLRMLGARSTTLSSVAVGHLFTTPLNTDRKLLTFSDSVQDAAHRAGFFGARTYRFALRSAVLAAVPREGSIALSSLGAAVWTHWTSERGWMGDSRGSVEAELTARLLPVDLHWLPSVADWHSRLDELVKRARQDEQSGEPPMAVPEPSPQLVSDVKRRLAWECTRELGVASRIGRTLEQSGSLSVHPNETRLAAAVADISMLLRDKMRLMGEAEPAAVNRCVAGLLHRLRLRGGVYDPLLEGYITNAGEGFFLSKQKSPLLSPFPRESSRPIFLTNAPKPRRFESITTSSKSTWTCDWLVRSLGLQRDAGLASQVYAVIVPELARHGLLVSRPTDERGVIPGTKATAWGLAPDALEVTRSHVFRRCSACGYELAGAPGTATDPLGHPCLRFRCAGFFHEVPVVEAAAATDLPIASYYKRFYERAQLGRLWSREHTGLLARGPREALELEFKQRPRPDSPNLLSCTPTLEMGIDIGDLSATLLCSVPPRSSNYVQRVGRAGRKTGNALILAFAASRPHDLYFFQDPLQAMAGTIHPPGCYLSAPEVLKRQALAFVFDSYARNGGTLPARVQDLWRVGEKKRFPDQVLEFLAPRRERLQQGFVEMFRGNELKAHARSRMAAFFAPAADGLSPLEATLTRVSREVRERRDELKKAAQALDERARKLQVDDAETKKVIDLEDERRRIGDERAFVHHQLRALSERDLFGWLTEEGCLPNYAFPERGVKLDAYIRRESVNSEPEHHEWVRAPSAALTELAPFNTFYASSRRVTIDGIEMRREAKFLDWRFCRNCHHAEIAKASSESVLGSTAESADGIALEVAANCPSCGDTGFSDVGMRRTVVPLAKVFAVTRHRDAVLGDDGDDRERGFYDKATLFEPQAKARDAWSNESAGFGFELQTELVMRQLNLGPRNDRSSPRSFLLAGHEVPDVRFVLCEECGQAHVPERGPVPRAPRDKHRGWCPSRRRPEDKQRFRDVHLLRELKSEALRLVLPLAAGEDVASDLVNLRAALRLGLRRFYGGEPDFLDVVAYDEPLPGNEGRRRYLVVMDRVPGGTGLLAELALEKGASLKSALQHAESALAECVCQARVPQVKACYQCLYAYREQNDLVLLERPRALALVQRVLEAFGALTIVDTIGTMTQSRVLESELEHRFVIALKERVRDAGGSFEELEDGLWTLRVGARGWRMRAQVELGADRVAVPCRADFVLYPEGEIEGTEAVRPIAIFTDGLTYHVCPTADRARLDDDAQKRLGISAGGRMMTWSLTWKDVVSPDSPAMPRWLGDGAVFAELQALLFALDQKQPNEEKLAPLLRVLDADPVRGLVAALGAPTRLDMLARIAAFVLLRRGRPGPRASVDRSQRAWRTHREPRPLEVSAGQGDAMARELALGEYAGLLVDLPVARLGALVQSADGLQVTVRIDDEKPQRAKPGFEASWRHWLRVWNLLQVIPGAVLTTTEAIVRHESLAPELVIPSTAASVTVVSASVPIARLDADDPRMAPVREIGDANAREVIARLLAKHPGLVAPSVPLELRGPGIPAGDDVEVGWAKAKVAAYLDHQRADAEALLAVGWTVFAIERGLDVAALERALGLAVGEGD